MVILVMGVAGAGKTTVGKALADALGWSFRDADDDHPEENVAKMARGVPLDDADRLPWLERLRARIDAALASGEGLVLACSALKESYRAVLGTDRPEVKTVFLSAPAEVLAERLRGRPGHFFPETLLASQLQTLEPPEGALVVDATRPVSELITEIQKSLPSPPGRGSG